MKQMRMGEIEAARPVRPATDGQGAARLAAEAQRIAAIKARAAPPESCGPAIPVAPARGACRAFQPVEMMPTGAAGWEPQPAGYRGRDAVQVMDVFDTMARAASGRDEAAPFTAGQVAAARQYRALVERHEAGGMRCASLEAVGRGGGGGGAFIDAFVAEGQQIARLRARIGTGAALSVRRIRPSSRGAAARGIITDRALVDAVCLGDQTLSAVLKAHGWASKGDHREALRKALAAALDRMQGYGGCRKGLDA